MLEQKYNFISDDLDHTGAQQRKYSESNFEPFVQPSYEYVIYIRKESLQDKNTFSVR